MAAFIEHAVIVFASVMASSGFWAFLTAKKGREDSKTLLLMGMAHIRIVALGSGYIERGWISKEEFDDFQKYMYKPYVDLGGNGLAEKIMDEVQDLPIRSGVFMLRKDREGKNDD